MSDQMKWFKVWTSILSDDDFNPDRESTPIGIMRFAMLGAFTALHGSKGKVAIMPDTLFKITRAQSIGDLRTTLTLKNVSFEEGKNRYGKINVTWRKWNKYQRDSTAAERNRTLRSKKRGEERRREEIKSTPQTPQSVGTGFEVFWKSYPKHHDRKRALKFWEKLAPENGLMETIMAALENQKKTFDWQKEGGQFVPYPATWLNGRRWEDEIDETQNKSTPVDNLGFPK